MISPAKSEFGCATVTYLGHVKLVDAKVTSISEFPRPRSNKQVMGFQGMAGYYKKFCLNFTSITKPLMRLLRKNVKFDWNDQCKKTFEELKAVLVSAPVLSAPNFTRPFKLAVNTSDVMVDVVLLQQGDDDVDHPICYFSRKLNKNQINYSTIEKEHLSLILVLQHFEVYVTSSSLPLLMTTIL